MNEHLENKNTIKPITTHYRLELITPDCFKYREKHLANGTTKIYKIPALKRYFAVRIRSKCNSFLKANGCIRIEDRYSTYYLPNLEIAKNFNEYLEDLQQIIISDLEEEYEKNKNKYSEKRLKDLLTKLKYISRRWKTNRPRFNVIQALPVGEWTWKK